MDYNRHLRCEVKPTATTCYEGAAGSLAAQLVKDQVQENKQNLSVTAQVHALDRVPVSTYYMNHEITSQPYSQDALFHPSNAAHLQALHTYTHAQTHENHHISSGGRFDSHFDQVVVAAGNLQERTSKIEAPLNWKESSPMLVSSVASTSHDATVTPSDLESQKAKIIAHPYFSRLVLCYANCHKIGAPPEVVTGLDEVCKEYQSFRSSRTTTTTTAIGVDPELDDFMHVYCDKLQKYHDELTESFKEAKAFLKRMEIQLNAITKGDMATFETARGKMERIGPSEEEDGSCCEVEYDELREALADDNQLKEKLLHKYGGYVICSLKKEFLKRKKRGKLPKEARQKLLDWWSQHYKWPYPSENEKASLATGTGLDQKQINNWFINQRKRHWKPPESMQYVMVDTNEPPESYFPACNYEV